MRSELEHTPFFEIFPLIDTLQRYEKQAPFNESVEQANEIIAYLLNQHRQELVSHNALVLIEGSLQYGDPVNLDVDLSFITRTEQSKSEVAETVRRIDAILSRVPDWPNMGTNRGHCETNFNFTSIEEFLRHTDLLDAIVASGEDPDDFTYIPELTASSLLTAKLIFPEQALLRREYRSEVEALLSQSGSLSAAVKKVLAAAIEHRESRRQPNS